MDVADHEDHYEMRLEMPGIPKEDISIEVTSNTIEISANHEKNNEDKEKNWLRRERSHMSYYRTLEFPEEILTDKVEAEMQDGVLTVTLPKTEPNTIPQPKKIDVK